MYAQITCFTLLRHTLFSPGTHYGIAICKAAITYNIAFYFLQLAVAPGYLVVVAGRRN